MKKVIISLVLILICISSAFALDYRLDILSFTPSYKEYLADRDRAAMDYQYAVVYDGYPTYFYQNNGYKFDLKEKFDVAPNFAIFRIGETLSLLKNTFTFDSFISPISFEILAAGAIKNVLDGNFTDIIGSDGPYFYGLGASFADKVSARFGYYHYCSHYGDAVFKDQLTSNSLPANFYDVFKYLRMNYFSAGLSIEPIEYVRLYGELQFLEKGALVRPNIFSPVWGKEGANAEDVPESYGARIINFGLEVQYPIFKSMGMTRLAYHGKAFEEGKIVYKVEDLAEAGRSNPFYDPDRAWEFEHSILIGQDLNDLVSLEATWHSGRFILNSFYATRSSYVSFGARIKFDGKVTVVNTAKN